MERQNPSSYAKTRPVLRTDFELEDKCEPETGHGSKIGDGNNTRKIGHGSKDLMETVGKNT